MKTALLAFDSKQLTSVLSAMLGNLGFAVLTGFGFDEAVTYCHEKKPDLLLTDWAFDKQSVYDLLMQVDKKTSVIFVSDQKDPADIRQALDAGVKEYIMKPFDIDILESKLALIGLA